MLNAFPTLLTYGLAGALVLRIALGGIFLMAGYLKIFRRREATVSLFSDAGFPAPVFFAWFVGLTELLGGLALIAGFGTQIAAAVIALISLGGLIIKIRRPELLRQTADFYIFALAIALSLMLTGAGFLAFDLPL